MDFQEPVERRRAAVEGAQIMAGAELLDLEARAQRHSKGLGLLKSRLRRSLGFGGSSRALRNRSHSSGPSTIRLRSSRASSAAVSALSRTNSLTDFSRTSAAARSFCFASGDIRRSIFSVRAARAMG